MEWTARVVTRGGVRLVAQAPGRDWRELARRVLADDPVWRQGARFRLEDMTIQRGADDSEDYRVRAEA